MELAQLRKRKKPISSPPEPSRVRDTPPQVRHFGVLVFVIAFDMLLSLTRQLREK